MVPPSASLPRRPKIAAPRGGRKRATPALAAALLAALLLGACATPRGLVRLEPPGAVSWLDDGSALALSRAIERSIAYYAAQPADATYRYGTLAYSPAEMIASLELFRETFLGAPDGETLAARIAERFLVFESVREAGESLFTGYYEPELPASETPTAELDTPLYALPADIVKVRLSRFGRDLPEMTLTGRVVNGELIPYFTRAEIQGKGALKESAQPIAYVDDVDLFFLQIQGSGVLRFPDGRRVKVGYAAGNGHPYRSIGALLVRRDAMPLESVSLQSIRAWLADNPEEKRGLLYANPSYVFFTVRDTGALGNLRQELTPGRSIAVDQRLIPPGGLVYVITQTPLPEEAAAARPLQRFMLAQDTGGAIRGHGRGDLFWGAGADAEWIAGHMKHGGRLLLLVARKEALAAQADRRP